MIGPSRIGGLRVILALLAFTWIPSGALHCLGGAAADRHCQPPLTVSRLHHHTPGVHPTRLPAHRSEDAKGGAAHGCCPVTIKCDRGIVVASAPLPPPLSLSAVLPSAAVHVIDSRVRFEDRTTLTVAHGPPTYLRNATLRI